jgi:hypothetical protein
MVTMLLFQKKQPLVYLIIALLPFGLKVMSRGAKNKPWGRIGAGLVTGLLVAYLGLFFAPILGLSEGTGLTLTRGDFKLPKVLGSKTGQEGALEESALDQFIQNYIFSIWRKTVENFGYVEYNASILEPSEINFATNIICQQLDYFQNICSGDVLRRDFSRPASVLRAGPAV